MFFLLLLFVLINVSATRALRSTSRTEKAQEYHEAEDFSLQLPLHRVERTRINKRDEHKDDAAGTASIGLGDAFDVTYNVVVHVGNVSLPLVLDTGSADLWVLSDTCRTCSEGSFPSFPSDKLDPVADARLLYGDSRTGTHAYGVISADRVSIAGLGLKNQYFAVINDTDTSVLDTGSSGIFGLGFPVNSLLWNELYTISTAGSPSSPSKRRSIVSRNTFWRPRTLPSPMCLPNQNLVMNDNTTGGISSTDGNDILSSFAIYGPVISRLILNTIKAPNSQPVDFLASPQFSVALQRTSPSSSGNIGSLILGALPKGVDNASLAWVPVRRYSESQNGVVVPQAPDETYPYAWDVPLDAIYFDGVYLPSSALGDVSLDNVGQSALIDTGNSLIRGPADIIVSILSLLVNSTSFRSPFGSPSSLLDGSRYTEDDYSTFTENFDSLAYAYPCAEAHSMEFAFSGKRFQVDPRDFGRPVGDPDGHWCVPNLAPTDPPTIGSYLYSWSLGEPFLRGVLASFYHGSLTHPSLDVPRVGFLSTVPEDATLRLAAAIRSAQSTGGYPETMVSAPTGTFSGTTLTTDANGVVQTSEGPLPFGLASSAPSGDGASAGERQSSRAFRVCSVGLDFGFRITVMTSISLILVGSWFLA